MMSFPDFTEVKRLLAENEESVKIYDKNCLIQVEWRKRIEELRRKIKIEEYNHEIQIVELKQEKDKMLCLKKLELKKLDEYLKVREYEEEVHEIKEKIIKNTNLEEKCIKAYDKLKSSVQNLASDVEILESSNNFQPSKFECQQLEKQIKKFIDGEKEKKDELMRLSLEYLHPTNWKGNLIKLVALRKKKLLQQVGLKIVERNNRFLENESINEYVRQKIQQLTQKIFDDLRSFDKAFGIGDFVSFLE